jgi:DNA-binding Lrp family transcriptional regulator
MSTLESRKPQYRAIYELLWSGNPRIYIKDIASALHVDSRTASKRMQEAFDLGYIVGPHIRKRSYAAMKEHIYFLDCKTPFETYLKYSKDITIVYHARMVGFANTWIVSGKETYTKGDIKVEGLRSDYFNTYAPNHSWEKAIQVMQKKVEHFDAEDYEPKGIIKTHWNETTDWDSECEKLYREFKYGLRKPLTPIMKKHLISGQKIYEFLKKLPEYCTISINYFPEGVFTYDPYLFMFETEYEDFIIDLFSQLPTSSFFFKVSDKLFMRTYGEKQFLRHGNLPMAHVAELRIPLLMRDLLKKGIIQSEDHAIIEYYWAKHL